MLDDIGLETLTDWLKNNEGLHRLNLNLSRLNNYFF